MRLVAHGNCDRKCGCGRAELRWLVRGRSIALVGGEGFRAFWIAPIFRCGNQMGCSSGWRNKERVGLVFKQENSQRARVWQIPPAISFITRSAIRERATSRTAGRLCHVGQRRGAHMAGGGGRDHLHRAMERAVSSSRVIEFRLQHAVIRHGVACAGPGCASGAFSGPYQATAGSAAGALGWGAGTGSACSMASMR